MWQPTNADEIEAAVSARTLAEGPHFDVKAQLSTKNEEIAKDIGAMTVDGGTLLYGVGEDANSAPTVLSPIPLKGVAEKIDQIVQTSIAPVPSMHAGTSRCSSPRCSTRRTLAASAPRRARWTRATTTIG